MYIHMRATLPRKEMRSLERISVNVRATVAGPASVYGTDAGSGANLLV